MSHFVNSSNSIDAMMDSNVVNDYYNAIDFVIAIEYLVNKNVNWPMLGNFSG